MIVFNCTHCGMKFQVQDQFAGRQSKCPTCKHALIVPVPAAIAVPAPARIEGPASSLHQAGLVGGVTLSGAGNTPAPASRAVGAALAGGQPGGQRYVVQGEIARGGMGAVLRAVDCDIRREVAVKYLLDQSDARKKTRFVEEAQITGQLEHPNIVPIHELGVDAQKRLFFSMKLVKGRSLSQVLDDLRQSPKLAEREFTLGRLLTIFVNICHALAYAHSRGVIHRDLKPANIMVGDFGEVYVMDWGLAKVLGQEAAPWHEAGPGPAAALRDPTSPGSGERVATNRGQDADLTQDGAILGTPAYMPPEQARGEIAAIDERSDIYSLGAILYEFLTLQPPVDRGGGHMQVLMRVAEGHIVPPEQRVRQTRGASPRRVPPELSAVALKALAKDPADRYRTAERLREDVERFLEGRSVSAKADTVRETVAKLIKRNKGASMATAAALVVLAGVMAFFLRANYQARVRAENAYASYEQEQKEKEARTRQAVPALLEAARYSTDQGRFEQALAQTTVAADYDPANADVRLLRAQLLIASRDVAAARPELERYEHLRPGDPDGALLLHLCEQAQPDDDGSFAPFVQVFLRQKVPRLAMALEKSAEKQLPIYRQRLDAAWPGVGSRLVLQPSGGFHLQISGKDAIRDLSPLQGIRLTRLDMPACPQVRDLTPLSSLPLTSLNLANNHNLVDLSPLKGLQLTELDLTQCYKIEDLTPLQDMPLTTLDLHQCYKVADLSPLKGMPLVRLDIQSSSVKDLTPLKGMNLEEITLPLGKITTGMEVLRAMKSLRTIRTMLEKMPAEEFWKRYDAGEIKK